MDGLSPELVFLNLIGSAGLLGSKRLFRWFKSKQMPSVFVVMCSRKSGLSSSLRSLEVFSKFVLVDVKENVIGSIPDKQKRDHLLDLLNNNHQSFGVECFPLISEYLRKCRKTYPRKPVILFTSDETLVQYLKIPSTHIACLLPMLGMYQKMLESLSKEDAGLLTESRERLIQSPYAKFMFRNYTALSDILEKILAQR